MSPTIVPGACSAPDAALRSDALGLTAMARGLLCAGVLLAAAVARGAAPVIGPGSADPMAVAWCDQLRDLKAMASRSDRIASIIQDPLEIIAMMDETAPVSFEVINEDAFTLRGQLLVDEQTRLRLTLRGAGFQGVGRTVRRASGNSLQEVHLSEDGLLELRTMAPGRTEPTRSTPLSVLQALPQQPGCGLYLRTAPGSGPRPDWMAPLERFDSVAAWISADKRSAEVRLVRSTPLASASAPVVPPAVLGRDAPVAVLTLGMQPSALVEAVARLPLPQRARDALARVQAQAAAAQLPGAGSSLALTAGPGGSVHLVAAVPMGAEGQREHPRRTRRMVRRVMTAIAHEVGTQPVAIDRDTYRVEVPQAGRAVTVRAREGRILASDSVDALLAVDGPGAAPWLDSQDLEFAAAQHLALVTAFPAAVLPPSAAELAPLRLRLGMRIEAEHVVVGVQSEAPLDAVLGLWSELRSGRGDSTLDAIPAM